MDRRERIPRVLRDHDVPADKKHYVVLKLNTVIGAAAIVDESHIGSPFIESANKAVLKRIIEMEEKGILNASDMVAALLFDPILTE